MCFCGPTAAGKSALALELAEAVGGELVNADSLQVYRHFNIGTGKPSASERRRVPHHLIDVLDPEQRFSAARFVQLADEAIREIVDRQRVPIVVGGTGLYVKALLHGLFDAPPHDEMVRREHEQIPATGWNRSAV